MCCGLLGLLTNRCLETPRGYSPDSIPRAFLRSQSDRESMEMRAYRMRVHSSWLVHASSLDLLWAGAFNVVGGRYARPCQDALRTRVHDLGRSEWSHRRCTGPAFEKVLISPTSCRHLTLVVASCGTPRGAGVSGCLVRS
jgi:hypothetical protein